MKNTIFDLVEDDISPGKKGFMDIAKNAPEPKDDSFLNSVSDYAKTFLKGSLEGVQKLGLMMGPLTNRGPNTQAQSEELTNKLDTSFPTDEGSVQKSIRRGLNQAPTALASPFAAPLTMLPKAIAAGFLGEGAKELGAPEWVQTAAELTAYLSPDITKKLLEKGSNSELIQEARKLGISDEALTPLLQSDFKQKWLAKLTPRRGRTQKILENTKEELQGAYKNIAESKLAKGNLNTENSLKLIDNMEEKLFKMPSGVRGKIKEDFNDLVNKPITGDSLMNFWADINYEMGNKSKQLSLLKEPVKEALKEISPNLAKDFEIANKLYSKYYPIAKKLEPNLSTDIMSAAKSLGFLGGVLTGDFYILSKIASPAILGKLSQEMLLNPRFQQLSSKFVTSLNEGRFVIAKKVSDLIAKEVRKIYPEGAEEIEEFSEEDFKSILKAHQQKK